MGHNRLGRLPRTKSWNQVVALIASDASAAAVAAKSLQASRASLEMAGTDPGFQRAYWLLIQVTDAANRVDFVESLRALGMDVPNSPTLIDITTAISGSLDQYRFDEGVYTDAGEMAQFAATEALTAVATDKLPTMFGTSTRDVQEVLRQLSSGKGFGRLARAYMARFLNRFLGYYLSRELSNHVGTGRRFTSTEDHKEFDRALRVHCIQAARIAEDFSFEWLSKTQYERGLVTERDVSRFLHVALQKVSGELARG